LLHRFDSLALDTLEQLLVRGDIVDESDDLTSSPDLSQVLASVPDFYHYDTHTKVLVSVQEHLTAPLAAHILGNLLKFARRAGLLDIDSLQRNLVREHS
jgi:hypothetical protein